MTPAQKAKRKKLIEAANKALLDPTSPGWDAGAARVLSALWKKKIRPARCPFCGAKPSGMKFGWCGRMPIMVCDKCGAAGPPANPKLAIFEKGEEEDRRLQYIAIKRWNGRTHEPSH